ncbi:MAG: electron transfer flavoprotein subunit alpha/FixB family protein [Actinomycetales bacterium]|nr:electron transfer flavoprotein subunit alpha/FixB family protein [Actinomycetales bacterium]
MSEVLVLVPGAADAVRSSTFGLLTAARRLGEPSVVLVGPDDPEAVRALGEYGAAKVYVADSPELAEYGSVATAEVLVDLARRLAPAAVLLASTRLSKDVAGIVAVRLGSGVLTDAVDVRPGSRGPVVTQSVFAGTHLVDSEAVRGPVVITLRPNAVDPEPAPVPPAVERVEVTVGEAARRVRVVSRTAKASSGRPDLSEASVVVAGGRGVGSAEGFAVVERLADLLGAAVGATRPVTDEKWCSHEYQIGQTGRTVAPQLYLATGISGAIQHRAGMQGSRTIVAINKDPKAPILAIADLGVVGDHHVVLPRLVEEIERRTQ